MKSIFKVIFTVTALCTFLNAQSDLLQRKAELTEEIRRLKKEIGEEQELFEKYRQDKEGIIDYKNKESEALDREIRNKSKEIREQHRELAEVEGETLNIERQGQRINAMIKDSATAILEEIDRGIPFEKDKRKAILSSLIYDIDNSTISVNESFARLLSFLNLEQAMSYDSQVIRTPLNIRGDKKDVNLIRIGRVFFAVDDGEGVYLWRHDDGEYTLNEEQLSPFEAREIRSALEIVQGKRVPDLVILPFPSSSLQKNQGGN